jgi:23S rRNA (cytosine1962-C5)-methyltransferase
MKLSSSISITKPSKDYALLDSGDGEKLERFGNIVLSRPDPQALWSKKLSENEWTEADGVFFRSGKDGEWRFNEKAVNVGKKWPISFGRLTFEIKPTAFKHVGLFPEQSTNWDWMREKIEAAKKENPERQIEVLNLFAYTGGASLACAQAGAHVVHVDGSKAAVTWARENAALSGLTDAPVRWILDDARAFVEREIKRGRVYDGIIMDPPAFGHGAEKEIWKIEEHFLPLVKDCMKLLRQKNEAATPMNPSALFFLINGYSAGYSAIAYENVLLELVEKAKGSIEIGELVIEEEGSTPRLLPAGIFARWSHI